MRLSRHSKLKSIRKRLELTPPPLWKIIHKDKFFNSEVYYLYAGERGGANSDRFLTDLDFECLENIQLNKYNTIKSKQGISGPCRSDQICICTSNNKIKIKIKIEQSLSDL
ncbi:hypothetical protein PHYBLDRAFT_70695 [Phycomyces blakesleeanus NRRL 1555(-)]|uniref:Uncharacterized protein n=1 Tax=Phycomyces blakesleeanus (strain ATCC 8743b / DSM 1359 / FGSC 10004 / NBRC 33097 / NRRL 1555) TaxID=763407 RepID=A0A167JA42_PHYB8|nr:hypothetical protein PHYBLDRAFT_70695 [Phycomyces blakesleeanus NRRL 1555(-)]OAD65579.1 hypothetical protein PHYBLDRAFT_70695 [Phycomyces blakesleeanus NRRL 1555(-)]|eukprot:XP_018283619.1 hypothetical protein PHYBLDRAFT_70695 [Phycomyces blakesleeanus NRRL 1555(-)]